MIVLGAVAGVTFVASYTFTSYIVVFALTVCQLTTSSLMPKLGSSIGTGEWQKARTIASEARELTLGLATGLGSFVILFNASFVEIWAGSDQFMGQGVNFLMTIAFVQFAILRTDAQIQDAGLDIGRKVILGAVMTASAIVAGGAAFALSSSVEVMFLAIIASRLVGTIGFPLLANRTVRSSSWPLGRAAIGAAVLGASAAAANAVYAKNLIELIAFTVVAAALLIPTVSLTMLSASTRRKLLSR
ncbi:hypothetical protein A5762_00390 [Mycolicibacterium elephantis]|nr:hypothetical protein A5762_00390 [Mycolicibacterium elephantis]